MQHVAVENANQLRDIATVFDVLDTRLAVHSPVFDTWGDVADSKLVWANRAWRERGACSPERDAFLAHLATAWRDGRSSGLLGDADDVAGSWVTWRRANGHVVEVGSADGAGTLGWADGDGRAPVLVARRAVALERARMARGLHDLAVQRLYASRLRLSALDPRVDDAVRDEIGDLASAIDEIISDIREQILRSEAVTEIGLRARIEEAIAAVTTSNGCDADVDVDDELRISDRVWSSARAVVTEAASNAMRHGGASMIWVSVERRGPLVVFSVADNGSGIGVTSRNGHFTPGNGMRNMENRAQTLGGTFRVSPRDTGGTVVEWSVPSDGAPR